MLTRLFAVGAIMAGLLGVAPALASDADQTPPPGADPRFFWQTQAKDPDALARGWTQNERVPAWVWEAMADNPDYVDEPTKIRLATALRRTPPPLWLPTATRLADDHGFKSDSGLRVLVRLLEEHPDDGTTRALASIGLRSIAGLIPTDPDISSVAVDALGRRGAKTVVAALVDVVHREGTTLTRRAALHQFPGLIRPWRDLPEDMKRHINDAVSRQLETFFTPDTAATTDARLRWMFDMDRPFNGLEFLVEYLRWHFLHAWIVQAPADTWEPVLERFRREGRIPSETLALLRGAAATNEPVRRLLDEVESSMLTGNYSLAFGWPEMAMEAAPWTEVTWDSQPLFIAEGPRTSPEAPSSPGESIPLDDDAPPPPPAVRTVTVPSSAGTWIARILGGCGAVVLIVAMWRGRWKWILTVVAPLGVTAFLVAVLAPKHSLTIPVSSPPTSRTASPTPVAPPTPAGPTASPAPMSVSERIVFLNAWTPWAHRYIGEQVFLAHAGTNETRGYELAAKKPADEVRVVGIGSSPMLGSPYRREDTFFARLVRAANDADKDPARRIVPVNLAIAGGGVFETFSQFDDVLLVEPDAAIIYISEDPLQRLQSLLADGTLIGAELRADDMGPVGRRLMEIMAEFQKLNEAMAKEPGTRRLTPDEADRIRAVEERLFAFSTEEILRRLSQNHVPTLVVLTASPPPNHRHKLLSAKTAAIAKKYGATVVDGQAILDKEVASGVDDRLLYRDDTHLMRAGHAAMTKALTPTTLDLLRNAGLITAR
ncbi:MAG: hypothetical protein H6685_11000 [Deltaproteobacteria bacterium]|nr:hypothetical protein [Deltaproteobacteria bacterium]